MAGKMDISERRSRLSPAKRALLEKRLQGTLTPGARSQAIPRHPEQDVIPLSFAQERLWFLDQWEPVSPAYNRPLALRLTGSLDVIALEQALSEIMRRHEVLRATFSTVEGRPVQAITPSQPLTLPVVDLSEQSPTRREAEARRLATEEAQRPFDLAQGPLLRAILLRLGGEEHVLLLVIHHIAFDGWSARVLIKELAVLYKTFVAGDSSPLPKLPIQYADFAHWQRQWLQGEVLETQLSYWKEKLAGAPPLLNLPTDRPRPAIQTYRGACQSLILSPSLLKSLKVLSRQENVTLFMALLATFKILLHRYANQDDIVIGSPIAGRTRVETEGLIGFFVNTLVLRTDLSGNPTFRDLLTRVREVALGAYTHQDLPFEKLVETLQPERDLSRTPLFQMMFNLENIPKNVQTQSLNINEFEFDSGVSQFDLTLELIEQGAGLSCLLNYNTDLFDASTITRMLGHYRTLLESIVADPDRRISSLPLLTEAERYQLLVEWNNTQTDHPKNLCVHQLFEAQVEQTPDAIAVVFKDQQLTYRELNAQANQLAHYLRKHGVGPEVLVWICVERSLEMVIGILGILKAGGAYVPLDPVYPKERLTFMLEDAQVPVLLTQKRLLEILDCTAHVICLDTCWKVVSEESKENPTSNVIPGNLAYVIYTSGSTGWPKGVAIEQKQTVNYLNAVLERFNLPRGASFATVSTIAADLGNTTLFSCLCTGGQLHILSREVISDSHAFGDYLQRHAIDCIKITPSHLAALQNSSHPERVLPRKSLILGGEASGSDWVKILQALAPDCSIINHYGPTEATVGVLTYQVPKYQQNERPTLPLGRPLANTQIYLLDLQMNPVPIGIPGELHIGGAGLARGYLNRPELTAEKFIPNPFSKEPGARLYRTGDLALYLSDGNIEFLGRLDDQVKIHGFRVELGEIEMTLKQHPAIQETVVLARKDELGDRRLVAYVVPDQDPSPTIRELRDFLKKKLPDYMVPSAFVMLDGLPLTPNGKVDRQALPAPDRLRPELEEAFVAPRTPVEEVLAGIWSKVLGLEQVGVYDSFFELGGHSLLATQVISRLYEAFQVKLSLRRFFKTPTVADLAVSVVQSLAEKVKREDIGQLLAELEELSDGKATS